MVAGNESLADYGAVEESQRQRQRENNRRGRLVLRPLSQTRVRVRKLDWMEYEQDVTVGGGARNSHQNGQSEEAGWWWDDTGIGEMSCSG